MNIGLLSLSGVRVRTRELAALGVPLPGFVRRGKVVAALPSLGLLTLGGMTPGHHSVTYFEIDEVPDYASLPYVDLIAISALTARIDEAYRIADFYRERGTYVVMGGLHVSV